MHLAHDPAHVPRFSTDRLSRYRVDLPEAEPSIPGLQPVRSSCKLDTYGLPLYAFSTPPQFSYQRNLID